MRGQRSTVNQGRRKSLGAYRTSQGQLEIVTEVKELIARMMVCRDHTGLQLKVLTDVTAVDYPERPQRFEVVYNRLSVRYGVRILVKVRVDELETVPSRTGRYKSANWM